MDLLYEQSPASATLAIAAKTMIAFTTVPPKKAMFDEGSREVNLRDRDPYSPLQGNCFSPPQEPNTSFLTRSPLTLHALFARRYWSQKVVHLPAEISETSISTGMDLKVPLPPHVEPLSPCSMCDLSERVFVCVVISRRILPRDPST